MMDLRLLRTSTDESSADPDGQLAAGRHAEIIALKASIDLAARRLLDHPGRIAGASLGSAQRKPAPILPFGSFADQPRRRASR